MSDPGTERGQRPAGAAGWSGGGGSTGGDTMAELAAFLTDEAAEGGDPNERRRRLSAGLAAAAQAGGRGAGQGARTAGAWLAEQVMAMAPRLRARNLAQLREQYPGRDTEGLAAVLIDEAARASAAVGAAVGAWSVLPLLPLFPAEVAAEMLAAVGIEIKLVAELHEVYSRPAPGGRGEQMAAYVAAWGSRRAVDLRPGGVSAVSPHPGRLVRRLAFRALKTALSFGPFFLAVIFGARMNRRETRRVGRAIRRDLRRRAAAGARS
jgi:hypothetical protein